MTPVLLGLGSNSERQTHLLAGLEALVPLLGQLRCSPVFESHAVGYKGANFYNLVVAGHTELPLVELDRQLKRIEADNGRYAAGRKGLPLDIDVLTYGDRVGMCDGLTLPRPEILTNAFVLWPLALLVPEQQHPLNGRSYEALWRDAAIGQCLWPVAFEWRGRGLTPAELLAQFPPPT